MITSVDTNVLVAILADEPDADRAAEALFTQRQRGLLTICGAVYSELCAAYDAEKLDPVLNGWDIGVDATMVRKTWQLAAERWRQYLTRRQGDEPHFPCQNCGFANQFICGQCGMTLAGPKVFLSDFAIGAHAEVQAHALLTYDRSIYRTYYPDLKVIRP